MESILDKVLFLLNKAAEQNCTEEEYQRIISYSSDGADGLVVGRVFGYSVSDYAIATLKWINKEETVSKYQELLKALPASRKMEVKALVERELYKQL